MSAPLIFVDLIKSELAPREKFPTATDEQYREMVDHFQPWRLLVVSGDNHEPLFRSTESYFNRADAIHAAELAFGSGSNVYLREAECGNVLLRLAVQAEGDDEWPVGEVQG